MTTTIIRSDKWNTTITCVPQAHEGKPLLRVGCDEEEIREIDKEIDVTADARDAIDAAINDGWKP